MSYEMYTEYTCDICGRKERTDLNSDRLPGSWYKVSIECSRENSSNKLNRRVGRTYHICSSCGSNSSVTVKPFEFLNKSSFATEEGN